MGGIEGLLAGHTLADRYRIDEVIGRGGFAAVYRAHDERLQRTVAVKVVMVAAPDEPSRERIRARFHREAQVAAQLQHPNVVTIFDFGTDEKLGLDFLVMELLHGEDLAERVARLGPPPLEQSLRILREAAEGFAAGHRAGLVHRDVKPGNIFLEERRGIDIFRVVVLDFGIALIIEGDETVTSLTHGRMPLSPAYAAPEHLRDERPLTRAADVYGLGVIGYELLTGERLHEGSSEESLRRTVPSLREVNPEIPPEVAEVIEKALAYDASARFSDAGEMAKALAVAQVDHVVPGPAPAPPMVAPEPEPPADVPVEAPQYRARRHPRLPEESAAAVPADSTRRSSLPLLLGVGLVLLLAVGLWAMLGRGGAGDEVGPEPAQVASEEPASVPAETGPAAAAAGDPTPTEAAQAPDAEAVEDEPLGGLDPPPASPATADAAAGQHASGLRSFAAGRYAEAVRSFRAAVSSVPSNAAYRNDLGWALYLAGELDEAARELNEVIRLDPDREIAYANLGEVRLAQGDTAAAIAQYETFLRLNSDPAREAIARRKLERIGNRE